MLLAFHFSSRGDLDLFHFLQYGVEGRIKWRTLQLPSECGEGLV